MINIGMCAFYPPTIFRKKNFSRGLWLLLFIGSFRRQYGNDPESMRKKMIDSTGGRFGGARAGAAEVDLVPNLLISISAARVFHVINSRL